jgi:hypothetical protein
MANYLQADFYPEEKPFVPDFSLIGATLQARQNQYDQGFAQLKSLHNSVLSSKVTNGENIEQQALYLKNIENKLKNLPSIDLSVDKNVNAAKGIFDPFFDDKELMRDISVTKISDGELNKGQSLLMSDDPKKRAMHSAISDEYVGIPLDELRRAKRGDGSIMGVKPRYYVPAVNLGEKFKDFLTKNNLLPVSETKDGKGTIVKTTGGKLAEIPLTSLFDGLVTGDDRKYFDAWGDVIYNRQVNGFIQNGLSEKDAKFAIAKDLATQTKDYYSSELKANESALERAKTIWEDYKSTNAVNGQVPVSSESMALKTNVMFYQQQVDDHKVKVSQFDFNKVADEYKNQGSSYWSKTLYNDALTKVVRGYIGATSSTEVKSDDSYWKLIDHLDKEADRASREAIAKQNLEAKSGALGGGTGVSFQVNPETGNLELVSVPTTGGKSSGSPAKKSKEDIDLEQANEKMYLGDQNVPKPTTKSYIDVLYDTRKNLEGSMNKSSMNFVDKVLAKEYPEIGALVTNLQQQYQYGYPKSLDASTAEPNKWENKGLNGIVSKEYLKFAEMVVDPKKDITANTPREAAFKTFVAKYGKEFESYLKERTNKQPTYLNIQGFLFDKAKATYLSGKSAIDNGERTDMDIELDVIDRGITSLQGINKDVRTISNTILNPEKKIVNPLMVTKNDSGDWRFKTKAELEADLKDATTEISRTPARGNITSDNYQPASVELKNLGLAKQLLPLIQSYDKNIDDFNKQVPVPSSLTFSADQFKLKQFGVYSLKDVGDVKGEDAEKAIYSLLTIANTDYLADTDKRAPIEKAVDETPFGDLSRPAVKNVIGQLLNSFSTSAKDHSVTYYQYSGIPGDDRKAYVIRFNDEYLNSKINALTAEGLKKNYEKTISGADAKSQLQALKVIQENGLKVFADDSKGISGSLTGEYNVFEKTLQEKMVYTSPTFAEDRYKYQIRKASDGTYELTGSYFIKDIDQSGNTITSEVPLANEGTRIIKFPYKASFTSVIQNTNAWVTEQLKQATSMYANKLKLLKKEQPSKFMTEEEMEKQIRMKTTK